MVTSSADLVRAVEAVLGEAELMTAPVQEWVRLWVERTRAERVGPVFASDDAG
jgi:hypothetical protein